MENVPQLPILSPSTQQINRSILQIPSLPTIPSSPIPSSPSNPSIYSGQLALPSVMPSLPSVPSFSASLSYPLSPNYADRNAQVSQSMIPQLPSAHAIVSKQPANPTICSILGVVKDVRWKPGTDSLFTVVSNETGKSYRLSCSFFCPARKGDILSGWVKTSPIQSGVSLGQGEILPLIYPPAVEPPSDPDSIKTVFMIYLKDSRFKKRLADKLYAYFEDLALYKMNSVDRASSLNIEAEDEESPILTNRNELCAATMEMICLTARRYREFEDTIQPLVHLGLTEEQADALLRGWYKSFSMRRLYLLGLTNREIRECCTRGWTPDTLYYQLIKNPYLVEKVPIDKARSIALRFRLEFSREMIEAGDCVRFIDKQTHQKGWVCYPLAYVRKQYETFEKFENTLYRDYKCQVRFGFFYLKHQALMEESIHQVIADPDNKQEWDMTSCSENGRNKLFPEQIAALENALNNRISIITGSAGSGKTTVISALCDELELRRETFVVCAFTGKAVARLRQSLRWKDRCMTMHQIIHKSSLPPVATVIVDETSMVANELFRRTILKLLATHDAEDFVGEGLVERIGQSQKARSKGLRIVLVGDPKQLQPIDAGDLFNQLIGSGTVPVTELTEDRRRKNQGSLSQNMKQFQVEKRANRIELVWGGDFTFEPGGITEVESILHNLRNQGVDGFNVTVVSPFVDCLEDLNLRCQRIFLEKTAPELEDDFKMVWKVGARVMMTVNQKDINVMNGEEGIVMSVHPDKKYIRVKFTDHDEVSIPTFIPVRVADEAVPTFLQEEDWDDQVLSTKLLVHSWAISVHKSQGSEWDHVIFYLPEAKQREDGTYQQSGGFLNRPLVYTGISRARLNLIVVAQRRKHFEKLILVNPAQRIDNLSKRLKNEPMEYSEYEIQQQALKANLSNFGLLTN